MKSAVGRGGFPFSCACCGLRTGMLKEGVGDGLYFEKGGLKFRI